MQGPEHQEVEITEGCLRICKQQGLAPEFRVTAWECRAFTSALIYYFSSTFCSSGLWILGGGIDLVFFRHVSIILLFIKCCLLVLKSQNFEILSYFLGQKLQNSLWNSKPENSLFNSLFFMPFLTNSVSLDCPNCCSKSWERSWTKAKQLASHNTWGSTAMNLDRTSGTWVQILALPLTSFVILSKSFTFYKPQFPPL